MKPLAKLGASAAGLCLLCCALPIVALFAAGTGAAGLTVLIWPVARELAVVIGIAGLLAAGYALWRIWKRNAEAPACDISEP